MADGARGPASWTSSRDRQFHRRPFRRTWTLVWRGTVFHPSVLALSVLAGLASCRTAPRRGGDVVDREVFGYSVEGRPITGHVLGEGNFCVFLFAVIHGDEPAGKALLERFIERARSRPRFLEGRRIVVVPVANPDGLRLGTRTNANGVDLNRNFPARNFRPDVRRGPWPESEPETVVIARIVRQYSPARIVAVHAPLHCINWDGPADDLAAAMARASGYPLRPSIGYSTPGSFGSWAGVDLGIPTITLELPEGDAPEDRWRELSSALDLVIER